MSFAAGHSGDLADHRDLLKPEIVWNVERGLALTMADIVRAEGQRAAMLARMNAFFDDYDLLLCPATIVAAFPVGERYLAECSGHRFDTYVDWLAIVYAITLTTAPALSLPCGFTQDGRPVGLQVVAGRAPTAASWPAPRRSRTFWASRARRRSTLVPVRRRARPDPI